MRLCRFLPGDPAGTTPRVGLLADESAVVDLSTAGWPSLTALLERDDLPTLLAPLAREASRIPLGDVRLLAPVEHQEVWAAGVTYLRSKAARMEESDFSASAYDRVYVADRPELFFKAIAEKVAGPGQSIGVRLDSRWTVPEPELALVFNSQGRLAGFTVANDVSARDLEGENLLYLPQAKIYRNSCALGPWLEVGADEATARQWTISVRIDRDGQRVFDGLTEIGRIKRTFAELGEYLFRSQAFPSGAVLLTGTGVVPPDDFCLEAGDAVAITVSGIGTLHNPVIRV